MNKDNARWWAMGATAMSLFVVGLDMTVLNVALPDIAVDLHASTAQLQWFADAYLLVMAAVLLPAGMLGDRFGRKNLTLVALAVFGLGSLWCALAGSPGSLIAARAVLGLGAAVLIPLAMSAVVVLFDPPERPRAILVLSLSTMIGLPLGPIVGGVAPAELLVGFGLRHQRARHRARARRRGAVHATRPGRPASRSGSTSSAPWPRVSVCSASPTA